MRGFNNSPVMSERERESFEQEKALYTVQAEFQIKIKEMELEIQKISVKWTQLFRLPAMILLLPIKLLLGIGYIAHSIRGSTPSDKFWEYLNKF